MIALAIAAAGFLALFALAVAGWCSFTLKRVLGALAALQQRPEPVLPGLLPLTMAKVGLLVEEALRQYDATHGAGQAVLAILLEQTATELLAKMPYDAGQRKMAIEQRLTRFYSRRGEPVPEEARRVLRQGGWLP